MSVVFSSQQWSIEMTCASLCFFFCNFVAFRTPVDFALLSRLKKKRREKKSLEAFVSVDSPIAACTGVVIHRVLLPPIGIAQRHLRFVW